MMDTILFDLDNTLYPPERKLFSLIDLRINRYMSEVVGIPPGKVDSLRRYYWERYGVTLQGLIRHYDTDPEDYLEYVHDVDVAACLKPDEDLRQSLEQLPMRKAIFTNGSKSYARRVLTTLGISDLFEEIFDIRVASYLPKPFPDPYCKVLEHLDVQGSCCVMVEDSTENLRTAKELGMGTVLVGQKGMQPFVDAHVPTAVQVPQVLSRWIEMGK
jgi:putative hydrolase of the HAD superfamily